MTTNTKKPARQIIGKVFTEDTSSKLLISLMVFGLGHDIFGGSQNREAQNLKKGNARLQSEINDLSAFERSNPSTTVYIEKDQKFLPSAEYKQQLTSEIRPEIEPVPESRAIGGGLAFSLLTMVAVHFATKGIANFYFKRHQKAQAATVEPPLG